MKGKTFLVTGGLGFIGSNIVSELLRRKHEVRVLDNSLTGNRKNLSSGELGEAALFGADIRDLEAIRPAFKDVDFVLHQAALPSVPRSIDDPATSNDINVRGTLNVLLAARDAGAKRLVYASSSSVYGRNPTPQKENMTPDPLSPYAVTKLVGEHYCRIFNDIYGLETVSLRYFNVFGPRQNPDSQYAAVIPKFIRMMLKGERPAIFGDGEQARDFTYVSNVVSGNILAAESGKGAGMAFNLSCGRQATVNELAGMLNKLLGTELKPEHLEERPGEIKKSLADISLAKKVLGYEPEVFFKEGLKKTVDWFKEKE